MLRKYEKYKIEDFAKDESFILWVKYGNTYENSIFEEVIKTYPYQEEVIAQAQAFVQQLADTSMEEIDKGDSIEIWDKIERTINAYENETILTPGILWRRLLVAASVTLLVIFAIWGVKSHQTADTYSSLIETTHVPLIEKVNNEAYSIDVYLPDSSLVSLNPNSKISYYPSFDEANREVFLSGSAFFKVVSNPAKPFLVYANELVTKVLGTSFNIEAFHNDKEVIVSVQTGKVLVYPNSKFISATSKRENFTLTPNEQVVFQRDNNLVHKMLVKQPQLISTDLISEQFAFTNAPVSGIFDALGKCYGVEIKYDEELIAGCRLTTSLSNETLFERLDIICEAIEAKYKVIGTQIIIDTKSCN